VKREIDPHDTRFVAPWAEDYDRPWYAPRRAHDMLPPDDGRDPGVPSPAAPLDLGPLTKDEDLTTFTRDGA